MCDEIDSSRTVGEEVANLMTGSAGEEVSEKGEIFIGSNISQFIGYEFTPRDATATWMKWDAKGSH